MEIKMEDRNIIEAVVAEDQEGDFGLYIIPDKAEETYITEIELANILKVIATIKQ